MHDDLARLAVIDRCLKAWPPRLSGFRISAAVLARTLSPSRDSVPQHMRLSYLFLSFLMGSAAHGETCEPLKADAASTLTLMVALQRTRDCHPEVRAAAGALAAVGADLITSTQSPNPQLTLGAGSVGRDVGNGSLWNKTFDHQVRVDQTIERGGKPALRRAAAEALREASRADLADALRRARLSVAQGYFELTAALARRDETAAALDLANDAQRAQNLRVKAGDAAPIDATRLTLDAVRVQADLRQAEADVHAARVQLATMLGAELSVDVLRPVDRWAPANVLPLFSSPVEPSSADLRPDVLAAQMRLNAAEQARALAQAQRVRDVSVGLQLDRWPVSATNASGTGNTVSVSLSVPLFVRHGLEGEIARAEADVANAREALRRAQLSAQSDLAQARSRWAAAAARRRLASEELAPAAERVAAGAELAYRRGATSLLDVLDARRSLRAAHIERINAEADGAKATVELEAASFLLPPPATP